MCDGLLVGNAEIVPFSPRRYLYHAYLAYMRAHGFGKPVTLTRFGKDMPGAMAEYGRGVYETENEARFAFKRDTDGGIRRLDAIMCIGH
ncbi:hypothetical protein EsCd1HHP049_03235 [Escherichia sp. HH154_1D]|nr:hypothetical protein EsCd1HHP049_03235 [Escherichia sp. HH154_1D]